MINSAAATDETYRKRLATLQAKAALAGYQMLVLPAPGGNGFEILIARWGLSKAFADLETAARWLERAEGAHRV